MPNGTSLAEINRYRKALGLRLLKSLTDLTETTAEEELRNVKEQWIDSLDWFQKPTAELGLLKPPPAITEKTARTEEIMRTPEFAQAEAQRALKATGVPTVPTPDGDVRPLAVGEPIRWESADGYIYPIYVDPQTGEEYAGDVIPSRARPTELDPWQRSQEEAARQRATFTEEQERTRAGEETRRQELTEQGLAATEAWRMAQLQQEEQQRAAQLSAQPRSWLEYAAFTGQQPVVQPWMVPIGQQYGLQAGQQIPGWTPEGGADLPQLTRPSAQYWARIGPTAQQQFLGYEQTRTGATPEETQFRQWSARAPGGRSIGLSRTR